MGAAHPFPRGKSLRGNAARSAGARCHVRISAYRAAALAAVDLDQVRAEGYGFQIEMVYRFVALGGPVVELPISFTERSLGHSKMSARIVIEAFALVTWWALRDRVKGQHPPTAPV